MNISSIGTSSRSIIESLVTSGYPIDDILQQLDSAGIEWYVTEQGDLIVRYWQVGAEGLIPPDHVARIRASQPVPAGADALEWLSTNLDDLRRRYGGQWVAIVDHEVIASAQDLAALLAATADMGVQSLFVTQIPAQPITWETAFVDVARSQY